MSKLLDDAKDITIGKNKSVVAVLLVISVRSEINKAMDNIINNKLKVLRKNKKSPNQTAKPLEVTNEAKLKPPPNRSRIFQGISLNQSISKINLFFPTGIKKNKTAPKIAILVSEMFKSKTTLICFFKTQRKIVKTIIKSAIFSLKSICPKSWY